MHYIMLGVLAERYITETCTNKNIRESITSNVREYYDNLKSGSLRNWNENFFLCPEMQSKIISSSQKVVKLKVFELILSSSYIHESCW